MEVLNNFYIAFVEYGKLLEDYCKRQGYREISVSGFQYLMGIHADGPLTLTQLAKRQGVKVAAIAKMTDVLSKKGYVDKRVCQNDWRSRNVRITQKGIELLNADETLFSEFSEKLQIALSKDEMAVLDSILIKLIKELKEDDL